MTLKFSGISEDGNKVLLGIEKSRDSGYRRGWSAPLSPAQWLAEYEMDLLICLNRSKTIYGSDVDLLEPEYDGESHQISLKWKDLLNILYRRQRKKANFK